MIDTLASSPDSQSLAVTWNDGGVSHLSAALLRQEAMDAYSRRARIENGQVDVAPGLTITAIHAVGSYGVNLHFSDGHEKAIYPFSYLRELSDRFDK